MCRGMGRTILCRGCMLRVHRAIREGRITSVALVQEHIGRIQKVNPDLNAMVKDRFDEALAEARLKDAQLQSNPAVVPAFHGVPCTVKESFLVKGMPNSSGQRFRANIVAHTDAPTVARLKEVCRAIRVCICVCCFASSVEHPISCVCRWLGTAPVWLHRVFLALLAGRAQRGGGVALRLQQLVTICQLAALCFHPILFLLAPSRVPYLLTSPGLQAGFIILGVTNTSELCMWWESNNPVYGRTSNPYDFSRIVGGSSGGEGSIVGACGSPVGLGADIGGSIRMPAFFNGVFGEYVSRGVIAPAGAILPENRVACSLPGHAISYLLAPTLRGYHAAAHPCRPQADAAGGAQRGPAPVHGKRGGGLPVHGAHLPPRRGSLPHAVRAGRPRARPGRPCRGGCGCAAGV